MAEIVSHTEFFAGKRRESQGCRSGFLSVSAEEPYRLFHLLEIDAGIEARAERPLVIDAHNRKREGVYKAARKIAFAGHSNNRLRPGIHHDLPGDSSARRHEYIEAVFFGDPYKVLYLASPAPFAIIDIMGESDRALVYLQAVRKQDKYFFRTELLSADKSVVEGDHVTLKALFPLFEKGAEKHKKRIKHLKDKSP